MTDFIRSDDGTTATAFIDLEERDYPFRLDFIAERTGRVVWTEVIEEPGAVRIPALGPAYGPIVSVMTFSDGEVWRSDAPGPA